MGSPINHAGYATQWSICRGWLAMVLLLTAVPAPGQDILGENLVAPKLQPLDRLVRKQLETLFAECDAAEAAHGRDSTALHVIRARHDPLTVHGSRLMDYVREHSGTPESLICLSYIVDWSEGAAPYGPMACAELLRAHQDDPVLSWLCTRCVNAWYLDTMEDFLIRLRESSKNPIVRAAATLNLAHLYDNAEARWKDLAAVRRRSEKGGLLQSDFFLRQSLVLLENRAPKVLAAKRDDLLQQIVEKYADEKPWTAKRTFGRLNYVFSEAPPKPTFRELAERLTYEVKNLRIGCVAPDFKAMDIDSRPVSLSEHRGKPILLMFSFKGCGACEAMYPTLRKLQRQYSSDQFLLLGVTVDETVETVREAVAAGDITWRCVWDGRLGPIIDSYRPEGYPTVLLLDREGRITSASLRSEDELLPAVEALVNPR